MPDELIVLRERVHILHMEALEAREKAREAERRYQKMMKARYKPIPVMGCGD